MSDTVKLIIEISKENLKRISDGEWIGTYTYDNMILNGTPLDDVKAEIEKAKRFHVGTFENDNPIDYGIVEGFDKAIEILDNIGKADMRGDT